MKFLQISIDNFFKMNGRLNRLEYLKYNIISYIFFAIVVESFKAIKISQGIINIVLFVGLYTFISLAVKRFHDLDYPGTSVIFFVIPILNIIILLALLLKRGCSEADPEKHPHDGC